MYRKTNIHTYGTYLQYCTSERQTDRQTDRQTGQTEKNDKQTNKQTDRQYMSEKTDRCTERPIFTHMVHTYITVHKKDIQTDRQTGQTEKNDKQTNTQTDSQYMSVV